MFIWNVMHFTMLWDEKRDRMFGRRVHVERMRRAMHRSKTLHRLLRGLVHRSSLRHGLRGSMHSNFGLQLE